MSAAFFASQAEFREWLSENDETEKELVVGYYKSGDRQAEHDLV